MIAICQAEFTAMIDSPMLSTPMISAPTMAPEMRPIPPVTAAPPMKHAAIASSSYPVPAEATAAPAREELTMAAIPVSAPMFTKMEKSTARVFTPDRIAAGRLPPMA